MNWLAAPVLAIALMGGCFGGKPTPAPTNLPSSPKLENIEAQKASIISANAEAADVAADKIPDETVKASVKGPISVIRSFAGPATDKDRAEAMALVVKAQAGKLAEAQEGWAKARNDADLKNAEISALKAKIEQEKAFAQAEMERRLKEAGEKAASERKRLMTIIFFGLGALSVAGGVVIMILAANPLYAANPLVGPKAGLAAIGAGLSLIGTGIAVNAIERALDNHPWIVAGGAGVAAVLAVAAGAFIYANHNHASGK